MRIVIVGVGDIGFELAHYLGRRQKNEIVLVDSDEKRCDMLAADMDALVLNGDGTDPEILKKAQLSDADVLVATTGSDPMNTVIAMLGNNMGVETIIVKLNGVGLRSACQAIGVRKIIAPKISAATEIFSAIYGFDKVNFSMVARGGLRLAEMSVGSAKGKQVSALEIPDGALLTAVRRENDVMLPRSNVKLQENDELLILIENKKVLEKLESILKEEK